MHEARLLATMTARPAETDRAQAEAWTADFRSWDLCDQCCTNLFRKCYFARHLVAEWRLRDEEFVKRAAFTMIAVLAVHDKGATDGRNFVKKAVNWALRQIGKRNANLNQEAIECARRIAQTRIELKG